MPAATRARRKAVLQPTASSSDDEAPEEVSLATGKVCIPPCGPGVMSSVSLSYCGPLPASSASPRPCPLHEYLCQQTSGRIVMATSARRSPRRASRSTSEWSQSRRGRPRRRRGGRGSSGVRRLLRRPSWRRPSVGPTVTRTCVRHVVLLAAGSVGAAASNVRRSPCLHTTDQGSWDTSTTRCCTITDRLDFDGPSNTAPDRRVCSTTLVCRKRRSGTAKLRAYRRRSRLGPARRETRTSPVSPWRTGCRTPSSRR